MKRNLNDILLEVRKVPITDEHEIMACINRLGNRTISSLLENIIEDINEFGPFETSTFNLLLSCHDDFICLSDEKKLYALRNITFKEFMCLIECINDGVEGITYESWIDNVRSFTFTIIYFAFTLLRLRGDKDVCDFMRIDFNELQDILAYISLELPVNLLHKKEYKILLDYIESSTYSWDNQLFKSCDNYDLTQARAHFLELANSKS
jgi:hypothetical protein